MQGRTSMHIAAWRGSQDALEVLLQAGGDATRLDKQGRTILHYAAMGGEYEIVEKLLTNKSLESLNVRDMHGWTPLHWACRDEGCLESVSLLLKDEQNASESTYHGWTPENIAIFNQADDILSIINSSTDAAMGPDTEPDNSMLENASKTNRWKVGSIEEEFQCYGCFQYPVRGICWRCNDCEDFNFCFKCYWTQEDTHPGHAFEKIGDGPERNPELEEEEYEKEGS